MKKLKSKKDESIKGNSILRWPVNALEAHTKGTHEERISWLLNENEFMYKEIMTAKIFDTIARLKFKANRRDYTDLAEYKALKELFPLWEEVLDEDNRILGLKIGLYDRMEGE